MDGTQPAWPQSFRINALADGDVVADGAPSPDLRSRNFGRPRIRSGHLRPSTPDEWNWQHPLVGWGLVAMDRPDIDPVVLANGEDLPDPIRRLLALRSGDLLRYAPDAPGGTLRRWSPVGSHMDLSIAGAPQGIGAGHIPRFLLIWGGPAEIPWSLQYDLQPGFFVGRLPLAGAALDRYVTALDSDWVEIGARPLSSVIWSVDHGASDITRLMRDTIADPLSNRLRADADLATGTVRIGCAGARAGRDDLTAALADHHPGLVVTTSHGATSPLGDPLKLAARLGVPVDSDFRLLEFDVEGSDWMPKGAFWYAHGCASAGTNGVSAFLDVIEVGSRIRQVLDGLAALPPTVSPLALALLGGRQPLRAFIGHVEPTFDWSLQDPGSGGVLTSSIVEGLFTVFTCRPIGWALAAARRTGNLLSGREQTLRHRYGRGEDVAGEALAVQLAATDWRTLVLLGDPAVALQDVY